MIPHLGIYNTFGARTHVGFLFTTSAAAGGLVAPSDAFEAADLRVYRAADGAAFSATQRSSSAGITMTSPFDTVTGLHAVDIDLTDNTDAGFYAAGYRYAVVLLPDTETVDGQTVGTVLAYFDVGLPDGPAPELGIIDQGTAQSATSTTLVLRAASAFADNTLDGCLVMAYGSTQGYWQMREISANVLSTDTVTVDPAWDVTPSGTITYKVFGGPAATADNLRFGKAVKCITYGTVGGSPTPTNTTFTASALSPAAAVTDQFKGLILAFAYDTTTAALRGQKTDITASTSAGGFTFTALTTLPQSGDVFTIQ